MAYGTRVGFEPLRTVVFGSITSSYAALGSPVTGHIRLMNLVNSTNEDVLFSFDGINDHVRLYQGSFQLFDFTTNKVQEDGFFLPQGTQIYVKYASAPSSGSVWAEVINAVAGGV